MIVRIALGQYLAQASASVLTMLALVLKRSSRVIPERDIVEYKNVMKICGRCLVIKTFALC